MRTKWRYGLLVLVFAILLTGGRACPILAAEYPADGEIEEKIELLQEGAFVIPDEDYSFEPEEMICTHLATENESEEEEAKRQAAAEARADNNATLKLRQEECAAYLYAGMTALERRIDVAQFALTREEFKAVISDVVNSNPELFYIRNGYKVSTFFLTDEEDIQIVDYCIGFYEYQDETYNPDRMKISAMTVQVEEAKEAVLKEILSAGMNETEKLLMLHEYIILHTEYDSKAVAAANAGTDAIPDSDFDIYGVLINKKAVCQGYALCYKYLSEAAGIRNVGFASNTNHVWNTVTLNGEGYYVDCTWDDPSWDTLGNVSHVYFLKGEADFENHGSFDTDRPCNGMAYRQMFWNKVYSGIFNYRGAYYYIGENAGLFKTSPLNRETDTYSTKRLYTLELTTTDSWDFVNAAKMAIAGDYVLYHDAKNLYAYNIEEARGTFLYTPELQENELIYGMTYQNNIFRCSIRTQEVLGETVRYDNCQQDIRQYSLPQNLFRVPVEQVVISGGNTLRLTMHNGKPISENLDLKAEILPEAATDKRIRRWVSSDTGIAVVDINGRVKGIAPGNVVITAISYDGIEGTYPVKVIYDGVVTDKNGVIIYYVDGVPVKNRFYTSAGKTYYLGADGAAVTGWQTIDGRRYYFGRDGLMLTGWQTIDGMRYYFDENGRMTTGWQTVGGKRCYCENGRLVTGWKKIGKNRYYFDKNGVMQTGWKKIDGSRYYLGKNGAMKTGWQTIGKKRYYLRANGKMVIGWRTIKKNRYYFNKKGVMKTGWQTIKGKRYYFGKKGKMVTGYKKIKNRKYYFAKDGHLVR